MLTNANYNAINKTLETTALGKRNFPERTEVPTGTSIVTAINDFAELFAG